MIEAEIEIVGFPEPLNPKEPVSAPCLWKYWPTAELLSFLAEPLCAFTISIYPCPDWLDVSSYLPSVPVKLWRFLYVYHMLFPGL